MLFFMPKSGPKKRLLFQNQNYRRFPIMSSNAIIGAQSSTTNSNNGKIQNLRQMIRAGVELLAHDIESGHPEVLSECLKAMAHFHFLSFGNCLMIANQRPQARRVAGFK